MLEIYPNIPIMENRRQFYISPDSVYFIKGGTRVTVEKLCELRRKIRLTFEKQDTGVEKLEEYKFGPDILVQLYSISLPPLDKTNPIFLDVIDFQSDSLAKLELSLESLVSV